MACFNPVQGYRSPNGQITLNRKKGYVDLPMVTRPCRVCIDCRLQHSAGWACRCVHEASLHSHNCFITLTYRTDSLPYYDSLTHTRPTLYKKHFQDFMKRFRRRTGIKLRYYMCGEYGEQKGRPHYHAIIFGFDFPDRVLAGTSNGENLYSSKLLESLWRHGACRIGNVTFKSAAYVARYILKKNFGDNSISHYANISSDGEITSTIQPEYTTMSRRPGLALDWFNRYYKDVYPNDFIRVDGKKLRPPRYYDSKYELIDPDSSVNVKWSRVSKALKNPYTKARLIVREVLLRKKLKKLKRTL